AAGIAPERRRSQRLRRFRDPLSSRAVRRHRPAAGAGRGAATQPARDGGDRRDALRRQYHRGDPRRGARRLRLRAAARLGPDAHGVSVAGAAMGVVFLLAGERTPWRVAVALGAAALVLGGALARPEWQPGPLNAGVYEHRRMKLIKNMLSGRDVDVIYHREGPTATVV